MMIIKRVIYVAFIGLLAGCPVDQSLEIVNANERDIALVLNNGSVVIEKKNKVLVVDGHGIDFAQLKGRHEEPSQPEFELVLLIDNCRVYIPIDTSVISDSYYSTNPVSPTITVVVYRNEVFLAPVSAEIKAMSITDEELSQYLLLKKFETCDQP